MNDILFNTESLSELHDWTTTQCRTAAKILELIDDCVKNPFTGKGKPEPLKYNLTGYWSRRIDNKNRLIYRVTNNSVEVLSCNGHYDDR